MKATVYLMFYQIEQILLGGSMDYKIRKMKPAEYPLLEDFLYEAIFQKDNAVLLPKTIINDPALQIYVKGF